MTAGVIGLFIERVPVPPVATRVVAAQNLLVIDACAAEHRAAAMLRQLEQLVPVSSRLVDFGALAAGPDDQHADRIWLLVDEGSDHAYCSLLREDLEQSRKAPTRILAVGADEGDFFHPAQLGRCAPWRRRQGLADGARLAARLIAEDHGAIR